MLAFCYLFVTTGLVIYSYVQKKRGLMAISYCAFLICFLALMPIPGQDRTVLGAPTQIVFKFDNYRSLQLTGLGCQGRLYYIDEQKQIYSELALHSARALTEPFSHMPEDYIFVPLRDYSGIDYSRDGGRTFRTTHFHTSDKVKGYYRPMVDTVEQIVVLNNQIFVLDKNRGIYRSPQPYGTSTGYDLLSPTNQAILDRHTRYMGPRWDNPPASLPKMPDQYTGWDRWQCDPSLKQEVIIQSRFKPFHQWQNKLRAVIGLSHDEVTHAS
ncbi:hypothetical protein ACGH6R_02295 [Gilliamella sp. CG13]|uniref:T6SS immunity protein Tli3 family protein n=1 Tax=Gilliamella sp. CG13 TaxID=3351502 RepID=UPI003985BE49